MLAPMDPPKCLPLGVLYKVSGILPGFGYYMQKKKRIKLFDLQKEYKDIEKELRLTLNKLFAQGVFILGKQVSRFEKEFASYLGIAHAIGVASGTDAIILALKSLDLGKDDEVIIPANSYPTAFAVASANVKLRLVDIKEDTYNIDPEKLSKVIGKKTRAIVVVHLYGQPTDMSSILSLAKKHKLFVIEDCAQAHGAVYKGKKVGTLGNIACFSFYPTKNLGAFGDGGMIVTKSKRLATRARSLRMYGEINRYESKRLATHSRLDELQAAVLRIKLKYIVANNKQRERVVQMYRSNIKNNSILLPQAFPDRKHAYHLFVVRTKKRTRLQRLLLQNGIETGIHFPVPIHMVASFAYLGYKKGDFPIAEKVVKEIVSLPCSPSLTDTDVKRICKIINEAM